MTTCGGLVHELELELGTFTNKTSASEFLGPILGFLKEIGGIFR